MDLVTLRGIIRRQKPAASADGEASIRLNRYGEQDTALITATKHGLANEGSYFVTTNPTPATAMAAPVIASYAATTSLIVLLNNDAIGGKRIFLDYIKIIPTVAPASGTAAHYAIWLSNATKYTSGGVAIPTPVNANMDDGTISIMTGYIASTTILTTTAATRLVSRGVLRSVIPAIGDEMVVAFGPMDVSGTSSGTAAGRSVSVAPPCVLGPGHYLAFNLWFPSNSATGISFEYEIGSWER